MEPYGPLGAEGVASGATSDEDSGRVVVDDASVSVVGVTVVVSSVDEEEDSW